MSSIILNKVIYPDLNRLWRIYEVNTTNVVDVDFVGHPTGGPLFSLLGHYSGGLTELKTATEGDYASVVLLPPNIHRDTLRSISINIGLFNLEGYSRNIEANLSCSFNNFNDYNQASFLSEDFTVFPNNPIALSGIVANKPYPESPDYTVNIDITSGVLSLNQLPAWNTGSYLTLAFNPTDLSTGLRDIAYNYVNISYYAIEPSRPLNVLASGAYSSANLIWNAPVDDGGTPVTGYRVQYYDLTDDTGWLSHNISPATTGIYIGNLINEHDYMFRVAALNLVGMGSYSIESNIITPEEPKIVTPLNFNDSNYTRIRIRRDTSNNWSGVNPILALGEMGYETDTRLLKVGDNSSEWNDLQYIKVDNNSIDFPSAPETRLVIGDSDINLDNPRININLSNNEKLNLVGGRGIDLTYSDSFNSVIFDLDQVFTPFNTGTLYSPSSRGRPGEVYYDEEYIYLCVSLNSWKRIRLPEQPWFSPDTLDISDDTGAYPSVTNIYFSGVNIIVTSDGDPYPAKASDNLANDGINPRLAFFNNYEIADQIYNFIFRYRGGTNTMSPQIATSGFNGIANNGVLLSNPSAGLEAIGIYSPPSGFHYNRTFFSNFFKLDDCGGYVNFDRKYAYYNGKFLNRCWNDSKVYNSNIYYSGSNYNNDYFRHADGHSKIIGFCYDGYPIYGPFGYSDAEDSNSTISLMTSSYVAKATDDHRPNNWKYTNSLTVNDITYNLSAGAFIEDFEYLEGSGLLDQYNGRYAVTPEYPNGTYAYYFTFTSDSLLVPSYPYIIGNYSKQQKISQELVPSLMPLTVDGYYPLFTASAAAEQYGLLNGGNGTYTTYTINSSTYYMPNGVLQRFPYAPTDIILSENRVSEKATINSIIGILSSVDQNINDTHTYALVSGEGDTDNTNFTIINNELRVNSLLSNDIQSIHNIRIRSTDQTSRFFEKPFTINVLPGTTLTSLSIASGISILIANSGHIFGSTTQGTATDLTYNWGLYGSPYVSGISGFDKSYFNIASQNIQNRNDETVNIYLTVKSISAFNSLTATSSFVLDHSENPVCLNGYYPLYSSPYDANRDPNGDGTSHIHLVLGVVYWMPNGLTEFYHGNYDCDSLN
jgi:hypothetical protein